MRWIWLLLKWTVIVVLLLLVTVSVCINLPPVQQFIIDKAAVQFSEKTGGTLEIERFDLRIPYHVGLHGLSLNGPDDEPIASFDRLEITLAWRKLLDKTAFVERIKINGLNANIYSNSSSEWNYDFIIEAFASDGEDSEAEPDAESAQDSETSEGGWDVQLGKLALNDISLRYYDADTRDSIESIIGSLDLRMQYMSLTNNVYHVKSLNFIESSTHFQLGIHPEASEDKDTTSTAMPDVFLAQLLLEDQKFEFTDLSDGSAYSAEIGHFDIHPDRIDLGEMDFAVKELNLQGLDFAMRMPEGPPSDTAFDGEIFTPLNLTSELIDISDINIKINMFNDATGTESSIKISDISIVLEALEITPDSYAARSLTAGLIYGDLPKLDRLSLGLDLNRERLEATDLAVDFGRTRLRTGVSLSYAGLDRLANDIEFHDLLLNLSELSVHPADLERVLAFVDPERPLPTLPSERVTAKAQISGSSQSLTFQSLSAATGKTKVSLAGSSRGSTPEKHDFTIKQLDAMAYLADVMPWMPDSLDTELLPAYVGFAGKAKSTLTDSEIDGIISLPYGKIALSAATDGRESEVFDLTADVSSELLDLRSFAEADTFYTCFTLNANLFDMTGDSLRGNIFLDIPEFRMDDIAVAHVEVRDSIDGDRHRFGFSVSDSALVAEITGTADLGEALRAEVRGEIAGADFQYIGLTSKDIRLQTYFDGTYSDIDSVQTAELTIGNTVVIKEGERIDLAPTTASMHLSSDSTGVKLRSDLLDISSASNLALTSLAEALSGVFKEDQDSDKFAGGFWDFDFKSRQSNLIRDLFLPDLEEFEPATVKVRYRADERILNADVSFPRTELGGMRVDSLELELQVDKGKAYGNFGIHRFAYDTLAVDLIALSAEPDSAGTQFAFSLGGPPDEAPYFIQAALKHTSQGPSDTAGYWQVSPARNFTLNSEQWTVNPRAYFRFRESGTEIHDFNLERGKQRLSLSKDQGAETVNIGAQRFDLGFISGIFELENNLVDGMLSAGLLLNSDGTFEGDGIIEGLKFAGAEFGEFTFAGEAMKDYYKVKADITGPVMKMNADGRITLSDQGESQLDLELDLDKFEASSLEKIAPELVGRASGTSSGKISVKGTPAVPLINGELRFKDVSLRLKDNNGSYRLNDEKIKIEPTAFLFPSFTVIDSAGQKLTVKGNVTHENFSNMRYDLSVKADQFTLVDIKEDKDAEYYGKLIVGADIRITGTQAAPVIKSDISLKRGSSMVFKVPEPEYSQFDDDGLVEWVSFDENIEEEIMGREKSDSTETEAIQTTIDLSGTLNIDDKTKMRIIIDPIAGDYLEIEGGGKLALAYDRAGRINLSGTYTVSSGAYQMTFYNIVKRKFLIEEGSRITWNGDPMSADLDLTAIYPTRASALGLMTNTNASAASPSLKRMLDWEVLMQIEGELEEPDLGFDLRLDKGSRGNTTIESRLAQLRESESELNKQVFALILFNSFISESGGGGGSMAGNQARNSASQMLTQQLNNMSDKLVGGVELTFDLQSYESSGMSETDLSVDLSKTLFDDRVTVSVGSTVALEQSDPAADNQQLMTNFVVEYKITEDGRYRLKAFRKTDVEDILVGRLTRTGAGFLFRRSFDRGDQIFSKTKEGIRTEEELEEEEEENRSEDEEKDGAEDTEQGPPVKNDTEGSNE